MYQGALGGAVVYGSKKMVYNFHKNENLHMLWSAKLVNAAGISIIENATSNQDFWEKWHIHIGFNRIELETKEKLKLKYKIMPTAFLSTIRAATKGKFSVIKSVKTGTLVFLANDGKAQTLRNTVLIDQNRFSESIAHELIHTFQYDDYSTFNIFFYPINSRLKEKYKIVDNLGKYLYIDYPGKYVLGTLYSMENQNKQCFWDNFFEAEANFYSKRAPCHWWLQE